jgi:hypothetical protein
MRRDRRARRRASGAGESVSRRRFVAGLLGVGIGAGAAGWWQSEANSLSIVPAWVEHALAGKPVTANDQWRPGTYQLQDAGNEVFLSLLSRLDRDAGFRPYFTLDLGGTEPVLRHDIWDWVDMAGRAVDGFARIRLMTGIRGGEEEEAAVRALLLKRQWLGLFWNGPSTLNDGYGSDAVEIFSQSRGLTALESWYALTGSQRLEDALDAAVAGLDSIAVHDVGTARYPGTQWCGEWLDYTNTPWGAPDKRPKWGLGALVALPLMEYHLRSGSRPARALAEKLLAYVADVSALVAPDGSFQGHVHAEGYAGLATAAVYQAHVSGREDRLEWAYRIYAWIRDQSTSHGWIPDSMALPESYYWYWYQVPWLPPTCETCALTDTLQLAIALAESGYAECWDDVDRFTRNHLLASQFPPATSLLRPDQEGSRAIRALAGSFASATLPNSLLGYRVTGTDPIIEGCCSGSGARALEMVWEHAVHDRPDGLYVHLGFNVDQPAAEAICYEPYVGQREVRMRQSRRVLIRLPENVERDDAELWVDGERREPTWRGMYADAGWLGAEQVVTLRYPLRRRSEEVQINHEPLTVDWKGSTVLRVRPEGASPVPYRRAGLSRAELPWQPTPALPMLTKRLSPML